MNEKENGSSYLRKAYGLNNQKDYYSSIQPRVSNFNVMYSRANDRYPGDEGEGVEDEETGEEDEQTNGVMMIGKDNEVDVDVDDDVVGEEEYDSDDSDEDDDDHDHGDGKGYNGKGEDVGNGKARKKRKLRTLISNYEFAPRVPIPLVEKAVLPQPSSGCQNSVGDWTERETFALLDAWGDRFLRRERKSLRAEEWQKVAEKVSQQTNIDRTDVQCRNRLDTLKKKYKKEKAKVMSSGSGNGNGGGTGRWVFYRKMDMLLSSPPKQQTGLSCGIDSGEYMFMNPDVYMNWANGLDEMRDSPENSESSKDRQNDSDEVQPKGKTDTPRKVRNSSSFRLLADSIEKFSDMYEKIESSKRQQMVELENMRMDFQRRLETQRRQILEKAQAEITKIRQGHDYGNDLSPENLSG